MCVVLKCILRVNIFALPSLSSSFIEQKRIFPRFSFHSPIVFSAEIVFSVADEKEPRHSVTFAREIYVSFVTELHRGDATSHNLKGSRSVGSPRLPALSSTREQWEVRRCSLQPAFHNDSRRYLVTFHAESIRETARGRYRTRLRTPPRNVDN